MTVDTAIARFRRAQRSVFRDEAIVTRPGEGGSLNPTTGVWTPAATTIVYDGPCLIRAFTWEGTDIQHGDVEVRMRRVRAKFPVNTSLVLDDIIVPVASTYDDSMIGISFRVTDVFRDGWQIARVCIAEEITEGVT